MAVEMIEIVSTIEIVLLTLFWVVVALYSSFVLSGLTLDNENETELSGLTLDNENETELSGLTLDNENGTELNPNLDNLDRKHPDEVITRYLLCARIIIIIVLVLIALFNTWLTNKLQAGVIRRNAKKIRDWFNIHLVLLVIGIILILVSTSPKPGAGIGIVTFVDVIYRIWTLYVARGFLKKLSNEEAEPDPTVALTEVKCETQP